MQNENDDDMARQPAIVRLGHHAIELGRAANEHGEARLIEMVRRVMIEVGREIAKDTVSKKKPRH